MEVPEGAPPRIAATDDAPPKDAGAKARRASDAGYKRGAAYALMLQRQNKGSQRRSSGR